MENSTLPMMNSRDYRLKSLVSNLGRGTSDTPTARHRCEQSLLLADDNASTILTLLSLPRNTDTMSSTCATHHHPHAMEL
jgi:hypothetical protein